MAFRVLIYPYRLAVILLSLESLTPFLSKKSSNFHFHFFFYIEEYTRHTWCLEIYSSLKVSDIGLFRLSLTRWLTVE